MKRLIIIAALALTTVPARAQQYGCEPERAVAAMTNAFMRIAPLFMRPQGTVAAAPPPAPRSRAEWKAALLNEGRKFCEVYPDDIVCGSTEK